MVHTSSEWLQQIEDRNVKAMVCGWSLASLREKLLLRDCQHTLRLYLQSHDHPYVLRGQCDSMTVIYLRTSYLQLLEFYISKQLYFIHCTCKNYVKCNLCCSVSNGKVLLAITTASMWSCKKNHHRLLDRFRLALINMSDIADNY